MEIKTKRLTLRTPRESDLTDIMEGFADNDILKTMSNIPYPYKEKDAMDFIKSQIFNWKQKIKKDCVFFIELKSNKKVIGSIGIHRINHFSKTGETGSWINKKYWRNGYMTEAKMALNDFAFNKLKLRRLESPVYTDNDASNATQIKMGYKLEGVKRKSVKNIVTGKIHDVNIYGFLKEDWEKVKTKIIIDR